MSEATPDTRGGYDYKAGAELRFEAADRIVDSRGGHDPETNVPHILAAQNQSLIGIGYALIAVCERLERIETAIWERR